MQALSFDAKIDNFHDGHLLAIPTGAAILRLLNNQSEWFCNIEKTITDIEIENKNIETENEKLRADNYRLASSKRLSQAIRTRAIENFKKHKLNVEYSSKIIWMVMQSLILGRFRRIINSTWTAFDGMPMSFCGFMESVWKNVRDSLVSTWISNITSVFKYGAWASESPRAVKAVNGYGTWTLEFLEVPPAVQDVYDKLVTIIR